MKVSKAPKSMGYWKKQREMKGVEAEWDVYSGKYKLYTKYNREMSGDDVGVWFTYDTEENEAIEVANLIADVLDAPKNEQVLANVKERVASLVARFPVYLATV